MIKILNYKNLYTYPKTNLNLYIVYFVETVFLLILCKFQIFFKPKKVLEKSKTDYFKILSIYN